MRRIIKKSLIYQFFYVICAIMIVIIIPCAADIFEDMYRINGRMSGYEEDSLYQDLLMEVMTDFLKRQNTTLEWVKIFLMIHRIIIHLQTLTRKQLIIMCMSTKANMPKQNRS